MTTTAHPARASWRVLLLAALTVVLALLLPSVPASAAALPAAETRVGASGPATAVVVGVHECITAGQRPVRGPSQPQIAVGNCVAAEAGDDWPVISGIVRDASKGKGNFGVGSGSASQAQRAGDSFVGPGAQWSSDGKALISQDGLRQWRPPTYKPDRDAWQANFQTRLEPRGAWQGNGHFDVMDPP